MRRYASSYAYLLVISGLVIALDQWTKWLVRTAIPLGDYWSPWPWLTPYMRLVHISNTGAAFGMFQEMGGVFTVLAFVVAAVIIYYFPQVPGQDWYLRLAMGLQLGGAVGNLIDRLTIGSVTDFVSVGTFAIFNVADASISVGVAVLVLGMWLKERQQARSAQHSAAGSGEAPTDSAAQSEAAGAVREELRGE